MNDLPINDVIADISQSLLNNHDLILEAPPGAGKTTLVPLALLKSEWLGNQQIIMLEPRRIAARNAAERMASMLGEKVGETVGYRIRHENITGKNTKIIVVTEGVLTRWLQKDPSLEGVALVIFDEFHERNLDSDTSLAFCLQSRELFRENQPLKILLMSATLEGDTLSTFLEGAPLIRSEGKSFPVDIIHTTQTLSTQRFNFSEMTKTIVSTTKKYDGNILVFLPGIGEIEQLKKQLNEQLGDELIVLPLHGKLSLDAQQRAIAPIDTGNSVARKIVLATDIAETSLTIEGIKTVIDSGLCRAPEFDPRTGMTRLSTKRINMASATQRAGRAGRLGPGTAIRMWKKEDEASLAPTKQAEILNTDLSGFALQLFSWGVNAPDELKFLDPPKSSSFLQAVSLLEQLDAVSRNNKGQLSLTEHGKHMALMPTHPRLAHLLIKGLEIDQLSLASSIAAILSERSPFPHNEHNSDVRSRLSLFESDSLKNKHSQSWKLRVRKQKEQFNRLLKGIEIIKSKHADDLGSYDDALGYLMACAYPDRIAHKQTATKLYKLSNGRQAVLQEDDPLQQEEWLVIADIGGHTHKASDIIYSACPMNPTLFEHALARLQHELHVADWDVNKRRFIAEKHHYIGKLCIAKKKQQQIDSSIKTEAILNYIKKTELTVLTWSDEARRLCDRVNFIRHCLSTHSNTQKDIHIDAPCDWPSFDIKDLSATADTWLSPYLATVCALVDIESLDLHKILLNQLTWEQQQFLNDMAPERIQVPSGSNIRLDYTQNPPVLAVKLQEMFGCNETPRLYHQRVAVSVTLLSPAKRPLQITQDLAGFWRTGYQEVKKEMKGRYPKHPWPNDPINAKPTRFTKQRSK